MTGALSRRATVSANGGGLGPAESARRHLSGMAFVPARAKHMTPVLSWPCSPHGSFRSVGRQPAPQAASI